MKGGPSNGQRGSGWSIEWMGGMLAEGHPEGGTPSWRPQVTKRANKRKYTPQGSGSV